MGDNSEFTVRLMVVALLIFSTALHEMAHAFTATWLGDPTPGRYGRLTLNPIPHLQPVMTAIILPLLFFLSGNGLLILAMTPVDRSRFRHPLRDGALVAAAGPMMNFLTAAVCLGLLWIPGNWNIEEPNLAMVVLTEAIEWSVFIGLFNLLPIPPLDGYSIFRAFIPLSIRYQTDKFARSGSGIIIVFLLGGMLVSPIAAPIMRFIETHLYPR